MHSSAPNLDQPKSERRTLRRENVGLALATASCMSRWRSDWQLASLTWARLSITIMTNSRSLTYCRATLLSKLWAVSRKKSYITTSSSVSHWCMTRFSPWITASSRPSSPCQATVESSPILLWGSPVISKAVERSYRKTPQSTTWPKGTQLIAKDGLSGISGMQRQRQSPVTGWLCPSQLNIQNRWHIRLNLTNQFLTSNWNRKGLSQALKMKIYRLLRTWGFMLEFLSLILTMVPLD